jgi:polar amino acid transport system substrate-binding protein
MKKTISLILASLVFPALSQTAIAADDKIQQILDRGTIRVCHAEAMPWGIKDPASGDWIGTDINSAKHLAETMGVKIEHVDSTWGTLIPSLETDKCDIVMAPLFRTSERALRVLFSDPSGYETQGVAVLESSGIKSYDDLDQTGMTVGVISGTADEAFANRFFMKATVKALVTDKVSTLGLEVANGRVDGFLTDSSTLRGIIGTNPAMKLTTLEEKNPLNPQGYSYALAKGEYDFLHFVNVWQINLSQTGLKEQWYAEFTK